MVAVQAADYGDTVKHPDGFGARRLRKKNSGRFGGITGGELIRCHRVEEIVHHAKRRLFVSFDDTNPPAETLARITR